MLPDVNRIKGIHPGAILKRELKKRNIKSIELAREISEHPQTINAISKERRGINPKLSYKLGKYFDIKEDYFMILQAAYEVSVFKESQEVERNSIVGKFRDSLFWDTRIELINIDENRRSIIKRILERGNGREIKTLIKLYSLSTIKNELKKIKDSFIPKFSENVDRYIYKL
jgi:addiction module HigA family antidote